MSAEHEKVADLTVERQRRKQEESAAAEATHHDLAVKLVELNSADGHAPVYANGLMHIPVRDGRWRPLSREQLQVMVARAFNGSKFCKKQSDYKQIAEHVCALCDDPE